MTAPIFQREGARIGGLTASTISGVARTDANGVNLYMDIYSDAALTKLVTSSSVSALNATNNYQNTCSVTGLTANKQYWYKMRADDGSGNSTNGNLATYSTGSFRTLATVPAKKRLIFCTCNFTNPSSYATPNVLFSWQRMLGLNADISFQLGDVYYSDVGTQVDNGAYAVGTWYVPADSPVGDAAATVAMFRSNFITTYSEMDRRNETNYMAQFYANTPTGFMWDDHDRGWNDMSGYTTYTANQIQRATYAQQAAQEAYMDLNAIYLTNDSRSYSRTYNAPNYYHVDIPGVRIIVMDNRSYRDLSTNADSTPGGGYTLGGVPPWKTMLGQVQLAWVLNKISSNPQPNLIFASPIMLDGYHGFNESLTDGWVSYSYERDYIIDFIQKNGNPAKTLICSGDTHAGNVARYKGYSQSNTPVYEILAGNLWPLSAHGFINGWKAGASGYGGEQMICDNYQMCCSVVDIGSDGVMTASLYELQTGKTIWKHDFI